MSAEKPTESTELLAHHSNRADHDGHNPLAITSTLPANYKTIQDNSHRVEINDGNDEHHANNGPDKHVLLTPEQQAVELRRAKEKRTLAGALLFCFLFMLLEFLAGVIANSLALLTDATHLLTDVGSYALSIGALVAAGQAVCGRFNYGWARAEVIGTLISIFSIWALVVWIIFQAIYRIYNIYQCSRIPSHITSGTASVRNYPAEEYMSEAQLRSALKEDEGYGWSNAFRDHITIGGGGGGGKNIDDNVIYRVCEPIDAHLMIIVGILGMLVNVICATILSYGGAELHGHSHSHGGHGHSHSVEHSMPPSLEHSHQEKHLELSHSHHDDNDGHNEDHEGEHKHEHDHGHSHSHEDHHAHAHQAKSGYAVNAAFLHALGDCVQSVGVIIAGIFIYVCNYLTYGVHSYRYSVFNLADPFCSILFAVVTLNMTRALLIDLLGILMESTPARVDYIALSRALMNVDGVVSIHDLHVWSLSADYVALSAHLVADNAPAVLKRAQEICSKKFNIQHTTIQVDAVECGSDNCTTSRCTKSIQCESVKPQTQTLNVAVPPFNE